jgi:hypothetical protein
MATDKVNGIDTFQLAVKVRVTGPCVRTQDVQDEFGEYVDKSLPPDHTPAGRFQRVQYKLDTLWRRNAQRVYIGLLLALVIGLHVFLGFAIAHNFEKAVVRGGGTHRQLST